MVLRPLIAASLLLVVLASCAYETPELAPVIPVDAESSAVVDAEGGELFAFHGVENRESVPLSRVPTHVQDAVLAIEDHRFWDHRGVDLRATLRALRENVEEGDIVEGGSTITQQYVKNALVGSDRTLDRKVQEAAVAFQLERDLTKEEILELYLNTIYFGAGAYGVQAAAREFFGVDVEELDLAQAALLAGVIRAPSDYDPFRFPDVALERRDLVVGRMEELGWIDAATARELYATPLRLRERTAEDRYDAPYFVQEVRDFILDDERFGETRDDRRDLLFAGGLRIETTLDPDLQAAAELAVARVLPDPADPDVAVVVMDPATGHVLALVGGHDFFDDESDTAKLNLATQGVRPTGSAFKPIVLAAAIEEGIALDTTYSAPAHLEIDLPEGTWEVENYGGGEGGTVDLVEATVWSYNTAYAQLVMDVGPADATRMAARLGVTSPMLSVPSAVLGTNDISPLDLTSVYATLAADGVHRPPAFVTRVEDRDGTVLYSWEDQGTQAVEPEIAGQVTSVLTQVVGRGTGANARIGRPVAGKTGTGQDWGDAWFVGYTPDLVAGVWVGFAEGQVSMVPPTTRDTVTGGSWPALIWQSLMTDALADTPIRDFGAAPATEDPTAPGTPDPLDDPTAPTAPVTGDDGGAGSEGDDEAPPDPSRAVPDVVGVPIDPATSTLLRAGLVVEVIDVPDDQYPPGIVVTSEPAAGEGRPQDGVVVLRVANGQPVPRVPDVLGLDAASAEAQVARLGVEVEVIVAAEDDPEGAAARAGRVWKADPATGTGLVEPGAVVTLWVNPG